MPRCLAGDCATGLTIASGVSIERLWTVGAITLQSTAVTVGSKLSPLQPVGNLRPAGQTTTIKLGWIYRKPENTTTIIIIINEMLRKRKRKRS